MGNPFQDKFLKAGLTSKKQVANAKREIRAIEKENRKNKTPAEPDAFKQQQAAERKRIKELNRQQFEKEQLKEQLAQVRELIEKNRLAKDERGEAFNFVEGNKIKRIYVSEEIADQLSRGKAAIVRLDTSYEVVPVRVAHQISSRDVNSIIVLQNDNS